MIFKRRAEEPVELMPQPIQPEPVEEKEVQQSYPADAYGLRTGMTVEVLTLTNRLTFVGKVDSYRNGAVVIREAKGDELPPVLYNKEIKLRFFRERNNLVVHGKICGSTSSIWKVDRLESKFAKEQRAFFRQSISPNVPALCAKRPAPGSPGKKPAPCHVLDISAGGVLVNSQEEYAEGDRLLITGVNLVDTEDSFSFSCLVRRAGVRSLGVIPYGCQFESISPREQDRLLRVIFILQREEIRRQKERDRYM